MNKDLAIANNEQVRSSTKALIDAFFTDNQFTEGQEMRMRMLLTLTAIDVHDWWANRVSHVDNVVNLK